MRFVSWLGSTQWTSVLSVRGVGSPAMKRPVGRSKKLLPGFAVAGVDDVAGVVLDHDVDGRDMLFAAGTSG